MVSETPSKNVLFYLLEAIANYNLSLYTFKNNNNNLEPDLFVLLLNWWFSTMIYVADYISVFPFDC